MPPRLTIHDSQAEVDRTGGERRERPVRASNVSSVSSSVEQTGGIPAFLSVAIHQALPKVRPILLQQRRLRWHRNRPLGHSQQRRQITAVFRRETLRARPETTNDGEELLLQEIRVR